MSYSKIDEQQEAELALLSNDEYSSIANSHDLEADRKDEQSSRTTEPEYQTPTSVKFMWLGSYFFFSMLLTLYNKLILGSVRMNTLKMTMPSTDNLASIVQIPLAINMHAYDICFNRNPRTTEAWSLQAIKTWPKRTLDLGRILCALHCQYCDVKPILVRVWTDALCRDSWFLIIHV
jgi:hypothetical protein